MLIREHVHGGRRWWPSTVGASATLVAIDGLALADESGSCGRSLSEPSAPVTATRFLYWFESLFLYWLEIYSTICSSTTTTEGEPNDVVA